MSEQFCQYNNKLRDKTKLLLSLFLIKCDSNYGFASCDAVHLRTKNKSVSLSVRPPAIF